MGQTGEIREAVVPNMLASVVGSGSLAVLATPWLVALMERAACAVIDGRLADSAHTTVGVHIDVRHFAPTPLGVEVRAHAELVEMDGRRLVFHVEAFDGHERIGEGTHERAIVDRNRLQARADAKQSK
jgi:predicted thioesterase